jgi:hypothetical protein
MTPAQAALEAKALASELTKHRPPRQTRRDLNAQIAELQTEVRALRRTGKPAARATRTAPVKLTHKAQVRDTTRKSLNRVLDSALDRKRKEELEKAAQVGPRLQFRREIGAAQRSIDAVQARDDAEADRAEAAARGDKPANKARTPKNTYDEFMAMDEGADRTAFYNAHRRAILAAVDHRE